MAFQTGAGLLDFLVLAILRHGDTYGYVLTQRAKELMDISDSTLYPVLRRLQKDGALTTYDQPYQGRNRRYYHLTSVGSSMLDGYITEWEQYKGQIDRILSGGTDFNKELEAPQEDGDGGGFVL